MTWGRLMQHVEHPFWINWLSWHLHHRLRRHRAAQRRAVWAFIRDVRAMPAGSLVIDAGANIGRITSAFVREGFEVHAFEPDPHALAVLKQRFGDCASVHIHNQAVGARNGTARLYRTSKFATRPTKATTSSSLNRRDVHTEADSVEVEQIDLVAFIAGLGRKVDLLKLDVEGSEVEILERLLSEEVIDRIGMVYAETHERHSPILAERTKKLREEIGKRAITNMNLDWK